MCQIYRTEMENFLEPHIRRNANGWRRRQPLYSSQIVQPFLNVYTAFYYNNTNKDGSRSRRLKTSAKIYIILQWSVIIFTTHLCLSFLCIFPYIIEFVLILWFVTDNCHCSFLPSLRCISAINNIAWFILQSYFKAIYIRTTVQKSSQIWYIFLYDKILFYFFIFFWDTFYKKFKGWNCLFLYTFWVTNSIDPLFKVSEVGSCSM